VFGIPEAYIGSAAGLATSALWTATSLFFTAASRRIGPTAVNAFRIALAIVLLGLTHRLLTGVWVPAGVPRQVAYLAASGVVGLCIGDQALLTAFVDIGPRLALLIMTTSPIFAACFGWVALGERLSGAAWLGVAMTLAGVWWVILERPATTTHADFAARPRGVLLALLAAACQAGGLLLSKQGMGHGWLEESQRMAPQAATLVRMCFAGLGMIPLLVWRNGRRRPLVAGPSDQLSRYLPGLGFAAGGAVCGPFLGVWMSLIASDRAPLGIAQTLCSLPPVLILPLAWAIHREAVTQRAVLGAFLAVAGAALLVIRA